MKGVLQQRACALGNNVIVSPISLCRGVMVASVVGQWVKSVAKGISAERFPSTLPTSRLVVFHLAELPGNQPESIITLSELRSVSPKLPCQIRSPSARCGSPSLCDVLGHVASSHTLTRTWYTRPDTPPPEPLSFDVRLRYPSDRGSLIQESRTQPPRYHLGVVRWSRHARLCECRPWRLDTLGCVNNPHCTWPDIPVYRH
jgi:hypothetical protein